MVDVVVKYGKMIERMLTDIKSVLKGRTFKLSQLDAATGKRRTIEL